MHGTFGKDPVRQKFEFLRSWDGKVDRRSREIRKSLRDAAKETVKKYPYVAGFSFFGSRVKGLEKEGSDIDLIVFIDSNFSIPKRAVEIVKPFFKETFSDRLASKGAEMLIPPISVHETVISRSSLHKVIKDTLAYNNGEVQSKKQMETMGMVFLNNLVGPQATLISLFHLDIGGSLQPWRAFVIDMLEKAGPTGERLWQEIMQELKRVQEDSRITKGAKRPIAEDVYPMTLERARKVYCPRERRDTLKQAA